MTWIDLEGLCNLRDVGGATTESGAIVQPGRLLRSDNLQDITEADLVELRRRGVSDVIDLRSDYEVAHAPSPIKGRDGIAYHHHSFFIEDDSVGLNERVLPWIGQQFSVRHEDPVVASYLSFFADRPDSVVAALRAIANASGAALVHCAAGKDRTGVTVALALALVGVGDDQIAADYALTTERIMAVVQRISSQDTYEHSTAHLAPPEALRARPEVIVAVLEVLRQSGASVEDRMAAWGWSVEDSNALRAHLLS